jgi:hypothetical protein
MPQRWMDPLFLVFSLQAVVLLNLVDLPEESSDWRKIK